MVTKKECRTQMEDRLSKLSNDMYRKKSKKILLNLLQSSEWKLAQSIGITISLFPEVDTYAIIEKAWQEKKQVAVPKCKPQTRELEFYWIEDFSQVEHGFFQLMEPVPEKATRVEIESFDLVIVPGLAFTKDGKRLGFGGGYYDRFLPTFFGKTIALAFNEQLVNDLPTEPHDYKVQKIILEDDTFICNQ